MYIDLLLLLLLLLHVLLLLLLLVYTTQHKDRVLQLDYYIQKTKKQIKYKQNYTYTQKSIINQLVIGENGQRGAINNTQTPPLGA